MPKWAGDARTDYVEKKAEDKFLAFDLETAAILKEDERLEDCYDRLGVSIAATLAEGKKPRLWHGLGQSIDKDGACVLVRYLMGMCKKGYIPVTWNGASFDFRVLAYVSDMWPECQLLALEHYDPCFQMFCERGFPVGLQKVSRAMGCSGKTEGMHGDLAPKMWADGRRDEVKAYVAQDVIVTAEVFREIKKRNAIAWYTRNGDLRSHKLIGGVLTVAQSLELPLPDTSWMRKECVFCKARVLSLAMACPDCRCEEFKGGPWPRSKFVGWLKSSIPVPNIEKWEY